MGRGTLRGLLLGQTRVIVGPDREVTDWPRPDVGLLLSEIVQLDLYGNDIVLDTKGAICHV